MQPFHEWLDSRSQEAPAAENLALVIAKSGTAGVSLDSLRRVVQISPETLQELLKALVMAGQVTVVRVGGQMVYRTTM